MEGYGNENPGAFQSTRPLRGATALLGINAVVLSISTHAPLAGRDPWARRCSGRSCDFNPRAPCGARRYSVSTASEPSLFQPTRPLRGATHFAGNVYVLQDISTHAPLAGRDSKSVQITMHIFAITDKFQMLLHRMPPVRAFCSFLMQENHADFGCEPPK